ncbi:MAG: hypothetical protein APF84_18930 [Gracilibacter sp. BRH_c7a]|nr:MAG: hypothetical protein APF84_18930 [Gracilibacter sp. BRH_c7a]
MQLFEEYGSKLLASFDKNGSLNSATLRNLTYSQALILLGIQEEERSEFIAENDKIIKAFEELLKTLSALAQTDPEMISKLF